MQILRRQNFGNMGLLCHFTALFQATFSGIFPEQSGKSKYSEKESACRMISGVILWQMKILLRIYSKV